MYSKSTFKSIEWGPTYNVVIQIIPYSWALVKYRKFRNIGAY